MKLVLVIMGLGVLIGCAAEPELPKKSSSLEPMYGGETPNARNHALDNEFIASMVKQVGSREEASEVTIARGWKALHSGDRDTAIRRFNQAWLLTPDNSNVMEAFALFEMGNRDFVEALEFIHKAIDLDSSDATAVCNKGRILRSKALTQEKESEAESLVSEAVVLIEKAISLAETDVDRSYIYYQWAVGLAMRSDFAGAWEKVHLSQEHGGAFVEEGFLETLSEDLPDTRSQVDEGA